MSFAIVYTCIRINTYNENVLVVSLFVLAGSVWVNTMDKHVYCVAVLYTVCVNFAETDRPTS